jgi:hypothetical protein
MPWLEQPHLTRTALRQFLNDVIDGSTGAAADARPRN